MDYPINQDNLLNIAKIDERMRRDVINNVFFAPFIGNVREERLDNGQKKYILSGSVVERTTQLIGDDRDHAILKMQAMIEGDPVTGDAQISGTGSSWDHTYLRTHVNAEHKAATPIKGKMDELRGKMYRMREEARPQLTDYAVVNENTRFAQAVYEGASGNVTEGLITSPNGIGLTKRLPPHVYTVAASGTINSVGTEGTTKTVAQMDTAAASTLVALDVKTLDRMRVILRNLRIAQVERYQGRPYWLWIISDEDEYNLKQDATWQLYEQRFTTGKRDSDSPLVNGAVNAISGFLFYVDNVVVRSWDSDTQDFGGVNGWRGAPSYATGESNSTGFIMGKGALTYAVPEDYYFTDELSNHDTILETAVHKTYGLSRADFFTQADDSTVFAKGLASPAYLATGKVAKNFSMVHVMALKD